MIDKAKNILGHKGRREQYGEAIGGKNSSKYKRYFEVTSPHPNGKPLSMTVDYYSNNDKSVLEIIGSWRKWYLGEGTTRDLSYTDTVNCIGAIAQKIDLPTETVMRSRFVNVEIGIGLRFRENFGGVIDIPVYFKGFDPVYEYGRESVRFKAKNGEYSIVFYDKITELMSSYEKRIAKEEKEQKRKGIFPDSNRLSKKLLATKMNKNNFSLRFEVGVINLRDCPPEFTDKNKERSKRDIWIKSPEDILNNWDKILTGLKDIFYNVRFCSYNLQLGRDYLLGKGLKDLAMYDLHLASIGAGGVRNYVQLHMKMLNGNHRNENIKKRIKALNNPPSELKNALSGCRNKEELLFETFNKTIERHRSKIRFRRVA